MENYSPASSYRKCKAEKILFLGVAKEIALLKFHFGKHQAFKHFREKKQKSSIYLRTLNIND